MGGVERRRGGEEPEKKRRASGGQPEKFKGLPPLKPPEIAKEHRVVLVACSSTGRASWAEFEPVREGYKFVRNVAAVPDLEAGKGKGGSGGGSEAGIPAGQAFWGGWSCGVCGADSTPVPGKENSHIWQCHDCKTIYCPGGWEQTGESSWFVACPGCGKTFILSAHQETGSISEYGTQAGSERRKGVSGDGSGEIQRR